MTTHPSQILQSADSEWVPFPGGELEGKRPKRLCRSCQAQRAAHHRLRHAEVRAPLCFQCYREDVERETAIEAAGELDTASDARFQVLLPFEAVNIPRLAALKASRVDLRSRRPESYRFEDRRRQAQIAARHALQMIVVTLKRRQASAVVTDRAIAAAVHAAELQLPEAWLPFVVNR